MELIRKEIYAGDRILNLFSSYAINRNNAIEKLIRKCQVVNKEEHFRLLEFGAGKGEFLNRFKEETFFTTIAVEEDSSYRLCLSEYHEVYEKIEDVPGEIDFIFLIDVLEHLKEDEYFLNTFHDKLKKGGTLFLYVPARMELYSEFDKAIGHYRRYSKKELVEKVLKAGFQVEECRYHDLLGYFASAIHNKLMCRKEPTATSIQIYDKTLVPLTNFIEKGINPPIGKSLYLKAHV